MARAESAGFRKSVARPCGIAARFAEVDGVAHGGAALTPLADFERITDMPNILIVEDERSARASLGRLLGQAGYHVAYAEEGMDALVVFEEESVDLVLLDLMLPGGMDGVAFLHTLRRDRRWKHTPVLVISSISDADFVKHIKSGGADGYFIKDQFEPEELLREVRSHLEHAKATC